MVNMKGRWCLITGAARGIGYLTAKFMAEQGANLILHSRKLAHTEKVLEEVKALADILPKDQLIAKIMGCLNSQVTALAFVLKAYVDKQNGEAAAE